ncbi:MAG: hypothetical protein BWK79_00535 [Beggiatoa sp. IS2]|nr:MAG: hypothetical protein BWK79_00535 [Beggiatoa sp. IS2]
MALPPTALSNCPPNFNLLQNQIPIKLNLSKIGFLESIGKNLKKYWKVAINGLTTLKELLSAPFDERAREILSSS